jgi:hypothetical protein
MRPRGFKELDDFGGFGAGAMRGEEFSTGGGHGGMAYVTEIPSGGFDWKVVMKDGRVFTGHEATQALAHTTADNKGRAAIGIAPAVIIDKSVTPVYVSAPGLPPNTMATVVTSPTGQMVITPVDKSIKPVTITPGVPGGGVIAPTVMVKTTSLNWWDQMWADIMKFLGVK